LPCYFSGQFIKRTDLKKQPFRCLLKGCLYFTLFFPFFSANAAKNITAARDNAGNHKFNADIKVFKHLYSLLLIIGILI
jgi:hypothetical protein